MALRCAVPHCESRYKKGNQGIMIYPFPENESLKFKWILQIPRQRKDIGPESGVCSLHFNSCDINSDNDLHPLSIPCIFDENPPPKTDALNSLFDLVEFVSSNPEVIPSHILRISKLQYIVFYKVNFDPKSLAEVEFSLYIYNDLTFTVYHKSSDLRNIDMPLPEHKSRFTRMQEIIDLLYVLDAIQPNTSSHNIMSLHKPIEWIRAVKVESLEKRLKVEFLLEQLEMLSYDPHDRQFSLNTLTSANIWKNRCSSIYEMLCQYLTLPDICMDDIQDELRDFSISYSKEAGFTENIEFKDEIIRKIVHESLPYGDTLSDTFQKIWSGEIEEYETDVCLIVYILLKDLCALQGRTSVPNDANLDKSENKDELNISKVELEEVNHPYISVSEVLVDPSVESNHVPFVEGERSSALPSDISFECCFCQTIIYTQYEIFIHCKTLHAGRAVVYKVKDGPIITYEESLGKFTCADCQIELNSEGDLNEHIAGHMMDYQSSKSSAQRGENRVKNQYRYCPACSSVFDTFYALKKHYEMEHPNEGSLYECQKCGEVFNQCSLYLRHKMYSHTKKKERNPKIHKCTSCSKLFRFKSSLDKHNINVHKSQPYVCTLCGKQFGKERYLVKHKARVHPKSLDFVCNICGKKCATNEYLRYHIKVRHSESLPFSKHSSNPEKYHCDQCDKSYMNPTFLANHIDVIHRGIKLFCCQICGKTCSSSHNLKIHETLHDERKDNYICGICGTEFTNKHSLNHHNDVVHLFPGENNSNC